MESYSSGSRGHPAKVLVRESVARVQIPHSPPIQNKFEHIKPYYIFMKTTQAFLKPLKLQLKTTPNF